MKILEAIQKRNFMLRGFKIKNLDENSSKYIELLTEELNMDLMDYFHMTHNHARDDISIFYLESKLNLINNLKK